MMDSPIIPLSTRRHSSQKEKSCTTTKIGPGQEAQDITGWQNRVDLTASKRNEMVLRHGLYRDVLFHVGKKGFPVYAHKTLLAMGSTVFQDMFFDADPVDIPVYITDVEPDIFEILLMSIYSVRESGVDSSNVTDVLKAARKYGAKKLEAHCMSKLYDGIDPNDHFAVYIKAYMANDMAGVNYVLDKIDQSFVSASKFESFLKLSVKDLVDVFRRDSLDVYELHIFNAAERWAEAACNKQKSDSTADNRRAVLGDALDHIRFPLMTPVDLTNGPVKSGLLLPEDVTNILRFWFQQPDVPVIRFCSRIRGPASQGDADAIKIEKNRAPVENVASAGKRKALLPNPEKPASPSASTTIPSPDNAQHFSNKKSRF